MKTLKTLGALTASLALTATLAVTAVPVATASPSAELATAPGAAARSAEDLKIATYNVMFYLPQSLTNWGQRERADLIARDGVVSGQDAVVFQEGQDNAASERLLTNLRGEYPYSTGWVGRSKSGWDATGGTWKSVGEDGGVAFASKWPISRKEQYIFSAGCSFEAMSSKGFAYARLETDAGPVNLIGTHLQSEDSGCGDGEPARVRAAQIAEIKAFIDAKNFPADEPVFLAGDLNVIGGTPELDTTLAALGAGPVTFAGPLSFDPSGNSIAAFRYPGTAPEQLDYVLPIGNFLDRPWVSTTREVHSEPWTVTSWFRDYTYTDYSDHYPVFGAAG
ncbi:sphingomyelin phosphodiesterase [Haematomicrobium sanguinis]|uniref:sphingomyelin phosphodiesterase n=1 Tax=Haematomicrobium sanguinis TaxID=479106 RepID=UPI000AA19B77|nr:sphingomyelin phosphodiesterase [Haematomicrobium sanguinis]